METLLNQLKAMATNASAKERRSLLMQLRTLQLELEQPDDTMERVFFLNCQMSLVRIAVDLNIFTLLAKSKAPLSVNQIAGETGAEVVLVGRILRYLACTGYIKEEGEDLFSANHITSALTTTENAAGIHHHFDFLGPIFQALPDYLSETKYRNITNATKTPLHYAYQTSLEPWAWFQTQPKKSLNFSTWAASREKGKPTWIPTYPLHARGEGVPPDAPLFVDVGGGFGQQSALVRKLYPDLTGRVIVQDFPAVLDNAPSHEGVQKMPHDFFTPQPPATRGARFYYLRQVLHDHSDAQATLVLKNLRDAMSPGSFMLIDEIVIPETGADWMDVHIDMVVMAGLAGMQRTITQWNALLKGAGLKCTGLHKYNPLSSDAILEVVRDE